MTIAPTSSTLLEPNILLADLAMLTFKVGEQAYGVPVMSVVRIIEMVTITHLPGMPDPIQGVINLRGKAVPIIDLRRRFGLPPRAYGLHTPIILVDTTGNGQTLGLVVDIVETVLEVAPEDLEATTAIIPAELMEQMAVQSAYLAGVAKVNRQIILILNVRALLNPTDQYQLNHIIEQDHSK